MNKPIFEHSVSNFVDSGQKWHVWTFSQ